MTFHRANLKNKQNTSIIYSFFKSTSKFKTGITFDVFQMPSQMLSDKTSFSKPNVDILFQHSIVFNFDQFP